jgi:hypothetical protein
MRRFTQTVHVPFDSWTTTFSSKYFEHVTLVHGLILTIIFTMLHSCQTHFVTFPSWSNFFCRLYFLCTFFSILHYLSNSSSFAILLSLSALVPSHFLWGFYLLYPFQFLFIFIFYITLPPIQWLLVAISIGVKQPEREADHSPPHFAEVKKIWIYTSTPPYTFTV